LTAAVAEAHHAGRKVIAHAISAEAVRRSVNAGVDGIAHARPAVGVTAWI